MDVKLQNAYVEVLLDNFMAVVKQNLMFQAQMEVMKSSVSEADDVKRKIAELSDRNTSLQQTNNELVKKLESLSGENVNLKTTVEQKDIQVNNTTNIIHEKDRLQTAVNSYMKQVRTLEETSVDNIKRIEELTKYIDKLETVVPVNKLKKLKVVDSITHDVEEVRDNVKSGGTF